MTAKRARTDTAKEVRKQGIIDAARSLFAIKEFSRITVEEIAAAAGVSKGTVFVYFSTREELFLAVARELFAAFFEAFQTGIDTGADGSPERLKALILAALDGRDELLRILPLLGVLIEKNVSETALGDFKRFLLGGLVFLGESAEKRFPFLAGAGGGTRFLFRIYGVLIGFLNLSEPVESARRIIEKEDMAPFRFDFHSEFEAFLTLILRGME